MFFAPHSTSRFYGAILILLLVMVTAASWTIVSLVQRDGHYDLAGEMVASQKMLSQRMALYAAKYKDNKNENKRPSGKMAARERHKAEILLKDSVDMFRLNNEALRDLMVNGGGMLGYHRDLVALLIGGQEQEQEPNAPAGAEPEPLLVYLERYANGAEALLNEDQSPLILDAGHDFFNDAAGVVLQRIAYVEALIKNVAYRDYRMHKHVLLLCVVGVFVLIALDVVLIYLPFNRRLRQRSEALEKEQDILITTRAELEQNEERLRLALAGMSAGIFDWVIEDDTLFLSDTACTVLGLLPRVEKGGRTGVFSLDDVRAVLDDEGVLTFDKRLNAHLSSNSILAMELKIPFGNNQFRWISLRGQAGWQDGKPVRVTGAVEDVTDKKQAEDLKRIFVAGIEASKMAVSIIDVTSFGRRFLYVSPGFCDLLGYARDHLESSNLYMLNGPETGLESIDRVEDAMDGGHATTVDIIHYKENGEPFIDKMTLTPVLAPASTFSADGPPRILAYVSLHEDMSLTIQKDRKDIDRQRHEALGRMARQVAEEIAQILKLMPPVEGAGVPMLAQITSLVEGLRGFSKGENDPLTRTHLVRELQAALAFVDTVSESRFTIAPLEEKSSFDLSEDAYALINGAELRQVMVNIIRNAQLSYPEGVNGAIHVAFDEEKISMADARRLGLEHSGLRYYVISVADEGCGIDPAILPKVFDPLFTTRHAVNASGLGLTVAQAILRSWGGDISLDSAPGKGTTVYLYIPVLEQDDDDDFGEMSDLLDALNAD